MAGRKAGKQSTRAPNRAERIQLATYRISQAALTARTLDELYGAIHGIVGELMPADNIYIALYDAQADLITFPYWVDEFDPPCPPKRPGRGLTEYVLRTGQALLVDETLHHELEHTGEAELIGAPSLQWLGVPLKGGEKTIGVLAVQTYSGNVRYGPEEQRVLEFVSAQIAMAVDRKQAEVALRESEGRLARAQEAAHLGSWEVELRSVDRLEDNPVWWSDEVYRIFGYAPREVRVSSELFFRAVPPDDVPRIKEAVRRAIEEQAPYVIQHRVLRPDGSERVVEERSSVVRDPTGKPLRMVGTVLDVTDRQRLEQQFLQSQKMEAVGRLAAGIAHDFNNLLTAILGSCELLREHIGPENPDRADLDEIRAASLRAGDLIRQLLAFTRQQVLSPQTLDLNEVVRGMEPMLRRVLGEDVSLRTAGAADLGSVRADRGQIEQVIMNLVVNARDALPRGGHITIETANTELDDSYAAAHAPIPAGHYALLAVSDDGIGMDAATRARVFEPFFTTKGKCKGTGLGLSTVYGIVKQSGGFIWVYSEPSAGATFKIYLPRVEAKATAAVPLPVPAPVPGGNETILVVEDQPEVRRLSEKLLRVRGYTVLGAENGAEALRVAEQHPGPIHLLVTDVIMPGMNGREVALLMSADRPALKVLYLSGYADESVVHHGVLEPGLAFLQKPFTPESLARKVRDVLDEGNDKEDREKRTKRLAG